MFIKALACFAFEVNVKSQEKAMKEEAAMGKYVVSYLPCYISWLAMLSCNNFWALLLISLTLSTPVITGGSGRSLVQKTILQEKSEEYRGFVFL